MRMCRLCHLMHGWGISRALAVATTIYDFTLFMYLPKAYLAYATLMCFHWCLAIKLLESVMQMCLKCGNNTTSSVAEVIRCALLLECRAQKVNVEDLMLAQHLVACYFCFQRKMTQSYFWSVSLQQPVKICNVTYATAGAQLNWWGRSRLRVVCFSVAHLSLFLSLCSLAEFRHLLRVFISFMSILHRLLSMPIEMQTANKAGGGGGCMAFSRCSTA